MATFKHPLNDYKVDTNNAAAWTLLFGTFYFLAKGNWKHVIISFFACCITLGASWFIYPLFARKAMDKHYLMQGYQKIK